jgi:hypothetical protein
MAIAKVGSTGSSSGAINYVLSEKKDATKQPEILAGSFGTMAEIKQEFEFYNKLNPLVKNQAAHISVSFSPEERVKTEKKIELAEKLLEKLDFKNVPFLVVEHHDKDYEHFHIIAGRIRDDGTTVKEWEIAERAIKATKELEIELGLKQVEYIKSGDRRIKTNEFKQMERTGELSVMAEAKLTIDEILVSQPTTEEFVLSLQRFGFEVRPNISEKNGIMNGFSFKKGEIKFKSSAIAKNYSWQNLQKNGLNYKHERDTEYLIGVKNESTQKLNLESGRDRGTETPKPIAERTESITERAESGVDRSKSTSGKTDRTKMEPDRSQAVGFSNHDSAVKSSEILSSAPVLDASKQPAQTKIPDRTVSESGHREKSIGSERNPKDNSGSEKSASEKLIQLEVSFSEPQLKPAPERETEKEASKNKDREKSYGNIMSR